MIALAASLWLMAWLWWSGVEVEADPGLARLLWGLGSVVLAIEYARSTDAASRLGRVVPAAIWSVVVGLTAAGLALAGDLAVEAFGPWLSYWTAPSGPLGTLARGAGLPAYAGVEQVIVQDWVTAPGHATSFGQLGVGHAVALVAALALAWLPSAGRWRRAVVGASAIVAAWLPLRFLLITRLVEDLGWLSVHWQPLAVAASLAPATWLIGRMVTFGPVRIPRARALLPTATGLGVLTLGVFLGVLGWAVPAPGKPAAGRVLIDDAHSDWEWITLPLDREVYGRQTTYNYRSLADFLAHHYPRVDVLTGGVLDDATLAEYDVLVLKTPTRPFLDEERDAVVRFVDGGGGLLLISDHTDLFGMSTFINPMGEPFGVEFEMDDTFLLGDGGPTVWEPPRLGAHPGIVRMPGMTFETSCTIKPRAGLRPVMVGRRLGSELLDYAHINFFGDLIAAPEERWGVFLQAAATEYGRGRVFAFTDSTVFSNFSVFYRGKPELALGMIDYLDRDPSTVDLVHALLLPVGVLLSIGGAVLSARRRDPDDAPTRRAAVLAVAVIGVVAGGLVATAANRSQADLPEPHTPMARVVFDDRYSSFRLPTLLEENVADPESCFDSFFVATQRMHLFPYVAEDLVSGLEDARVYVVINPDSVPTPTERDRLYAWVRDGGTLLVMDGLTGAHLAANAFLEPAELLISAAFPGQDVPSESGLALYGGQSVDLAALSRPVAGLPDGREPQVPLVSVAELGRGRVVALLGSERLSFESMGPVFNKPTPLQRFAYELTYTLFEQVALPGGWEPTCDRIGFVTGGDAPREDPGHAN